MSLIIRLIGRENDYDIRQIINDINQYLYEAGLPKYHLVSDLFPYDIPLPWTRCSWSNFNNLRYLAVKSRKNLSLAHDDVIDDPEIRAELLNEQIIKQDLRKCDNWWSVRDAISLILTFIYFHSVTHPTGKICQLRKS